MSSSGPEARATGAFVRAARPEDVPRVWELMRALAIYERMTDVHTSTPDQLAAQLFGAGAWPKVECLVAETAGTGGAAGARGTIIGYAIFYGCYSSFRGKPVVWLEDLYVTAERRGTGAGLALMRALAALAVERGCARVAWDVLDWNQPSIDFYERLGATRGTEWHTYTLAGKPLEELGKS